MSDPPEAPIVEWHRFDRARDRTRSFTRGALLVGVGSVVVGASNTPWVVTGWWRLLVLAVGLVLVALGPATIIYSFRRVMRHDGFIAMRTDGIVLEDDGRQAFIAWRELASVSALANDEGIVLRTESGAEHVLRQGFSGVTGNELEKHIAEAHRKALFGLYRPS